MSSALQNTYDFPRHRPTLVPLILLVSYRRPLSVSLSHIEGTVPEVLPNPPSPCLASAVAIRSRCRTAPSPCPPPLPPMLVLCSKIIPLHVPLRVHVSALRLLSMGNHRFRPRIIAAPLMGTPPFFLASPKNSVYASYFLTSSRACLRCTRVLPRRHV